MYGDDREHPAYTARHDGAYGIGYPPLPAAVGAAVWTPEKNADRGLAMALSNRELWGGYIFVSETCPGYVVWFDASYTPSAIFTHEFTRGHTGALNPALGQWSAPVREPWRWRICDATGVEHSGTVLAVDPRDALSRALTADAPEGYLLGETLGISYDLLRDIPANGDEGFVANIDQWQLSVSRAPELAPEPEAPSGPQFRP